MEKDNYLFKLLFFLFIIGVVVYVAIDDSSHKGKTFCYEVITIIRKGRAKALPLLII